MKRYILYDSSTGEWGWDREMTESDKNDLNAILRKEKSNWRWIGYHHYEDCPACSSGTYLCGY